MFYWGRKHFLWMTSSLLKGVKDRQVLNCHASMEHLDGVKIGGIRDGGSGGSDIIGVSEKNNV